MSPLNPRNTTTVGPEKYNIAEAENKDFRRAFTNMLQAFKEEINETIKETLENTNIGGMK